jgi:hypothetical protein
VKFDSASETEFPCQLNLLQRIGLGRLHIISVVGIRDDCIETVVIERVEEFAAELKSGAIADLDPFDRGKIPLAKTGNYNRHRGVRCNCSRTIPHRADDRAFQFLALHQNGEHINRGAGAATWSLSADILKPPKKILDLRVVFKVPKLGSPSPSNGGSDRGRKRIGQGTRLPTDSFQFGKLQSIRSTSFVHDQRKDCPQKLLRAVKVHLRSLTED